MSRQVPDKIRKRWELSLEFAPLEKADDDQRVAIGWAIICTKGGEDYYDTQGDNIPVESMWKAVSKFMKGARVAKVMHEGEQAGMVLYSLPLDNRTKKALGISCDVEGWAVGVEFDEAAWKLVKKGFLKGFSIGGWRYEDEDIPDEEAA